MIIPSKATTTIDVFFAFHSIFKRFYYQSPSLEDTESEVVVGKEVVSSSASNRLHPGFRRSIIVLRNDVSVKKFRSTGYNAVRGDTKDIQASW